MFKGLADCGLCMKLERVVTRQRNKVTAYFVTFPFFQLWIKMSGSENKGKPSHCQIESYYFQVCSKLWTENSLMSVQAFLDDCDVSGKRFASPRLRLTLSHSKVLVTRLIFLSHVGFCGKNNVPPQYEVNFSFQKKKLFFIEALNLIISGYCGWIW